MASLVVFTSAGGIAVLTRAGPEVVAQMQGEDQPSESTTTTTSTTTGPSTTTTTEPPEVPTCSADDSPVDGDPLADWATIVVDPRRRLPQDFEPPDLKRVTLDATNGDIRIRELVVSDLTKMLQAAHDNGSPLTLVSGYRSHSRQETLYERRVDAVGEEATGETLAKPGHSEHQLGTAVDVLTPGMTDLNADFGDTPAGQWVAKNAHKYGFVVSYPKGTQDTTCYGYEPWHIRYVGRDVAEKIVDSDLTSREWMYSEEQ